MGKGHNKHKRRRNVKLQSRRAASWARGKLRSEKRAAAQEQRHRDNQRKAAAGELTLWQAVKAVRRDRRAAKRADWERRQREDVLSAS